MSDPNPSTERVTFTIDVLPARCEVEIVSCGPLLMATARNIDTGVQGPLTTIDESHALEWAQLDPDGAVAA